MSAYFLWLNAHRQQIKDDNPGISITEISKKGGEMWSKVSDKSVSITRLCICVICNQHAYLSPYCPGEEDFDRFLAQSEKIT